MNFNINTVSLRIFLIKKSNILWGQKFQSDVISDIGTLSHQLSLEHDVTRIVHTVTWHYLRNWNMEKIVKTALLVPKNLANSTADCCKKFYCVRKQSRAFNLRFLKVHQNWKFNNPNHSPLSANLGKKIQKSENE